MAKRVTKQEQALALSVFRPVGYIKAGFETDDEAVAALQGLKDAGFGPDDLMHYAPQEEAELMRRLLDHVSGSSEFGHEVVLMRKYCELARQGWGFVLVYAPHEPEQQRAMQVLRRHDARMAERYGSIVIEHLMAEEE
jgi:hypothetical protein